MSANSLHRWTTSQRLALALSVVSSALLGLVVSLTIIRSPYLCTEELRFKEWVLCELGETWPNEFRNPKAGDE
jgi:hypothetical protein